MVGSQGMGLRRLEEQLGALGWDLETRSDMCGKARVWPSCTGGV